MLAADGKQSGDPIRVARAILSAAEAEYPPLHLVLGGSALEQFRQKVADLQGEWAAWEHVTRGTDFPDAEKATGDDRLLSAPSAASSP